MSIFSIILGLIASGFAVHNAGNFKGTWNKPAESYTGSSFFSPKVKKGFDVTDKFAKTAGPALIAIQSFTGDAIKTAALQSVIDVTGGKLPKSGDQLSKTISNAGDEFKTNFGSKKPTHVNKNDSISNISSSDDFNTNEGLDLSSAKSSSVIQQPPSTHYIDNEQQASSAPDVINEDAASGTPAPASANSDAHTAEHSDVADIQPASNVSLIETE